MNNSSEIDMAQHNLDKKRQISQMYQYYNYLIFEKNKDSFNDINPDLRKMTYKYDSEVKNAYMTVQASPEVIKAAMGMTNAAKNSNNNAQDNAALSAVATHGVRQLNPGVGLLGVKEKKEEKVKRYTKDAILNVFSKNEDKLVCPLEEPKRYKISLESQEILKLLMNEQPRKV